MAYDIYIGEAVIDLDAAKEDGELKLHVEALELPDAPRFSNDFRPGANDRHPSYSGWIAFATDTGLSDFFFSNETGLMREHPGIFLLTKHHLAIVRVATKGNNRLGSPGGAVICCS